MTRRIICVDLIGCVMVSVASSGSQLKEGCWLNQKTVSAEYVLEGLIKKEVLRYVRV